MEDLGPWVADHIPGASGDLQIEQLSGGSSNLTFRVRDGEHDWVLRRPPLSHVLATANDMKREYTVQRGLHGTDVPVPEVVAFCDDESVIGGSFYLMERLDGIVFNDASDVAHLDEAQSLAATYELMDVLARLHAVDPEAVGLGTFGKPTGFVTRQVGRWSTQWEKSKQRELPEIDEVARILAAAIPPEGAASIVHGDYSFNNTMFRRDEPARMQAVLDWEMSTLGDPLTDVGMVAMYWTEVGEMMWAKREHPQPHRANAGFPTVDDLLERYATSSGRDLSGIDFYRALATFKLAVITEGAHARIAGTGDAERAAVTDATVRQLASMALDAAKGLNS
ncbi:MAG: putative aminoglycoside phosphotransferase [Acidimicrobiales bacterium]|nr:putative aminoglycoside phosphotransferase [Acidimicrobiales bacterium]